MEQQTYTTLEEARAIAVDAYAAVVTNGAEYAVPMHNEYTADGAPAEGGLDWYLEEGWKIA